MHEVERCHTQVYQGLRTISRLPGVGTEVLISFPASSLRSRDSVSDSIDAVANTGSAFIRS